MKVADGSRLPQGAATGRLLFQGDHGPPSLPHLKVIPNRNEGRAASRPTDSTIRHTRIPRVDVICCPEHLTSWARVGELARMAMVRRSR